MNDEKGWIVGFAVGLFLIGAILFFTITPQGRGIWNQSMYELHKVDDATKYSTRKQVEDACRAMIASYESDRLIWEQYSGSENPEKQSWGEQAKMRANSTAASYNEYVLKNSLVWDGNIPADISGKLEYIGR